MRKQIYSKIKHRILSIQNSENKTLFKHFGLWNQQTENSESSEQETLFQTPAVFLEFAPMKWQARGNGVQETDLTIRLHIVTEYANEQTPELFDIVDCVTAVMHNSSSLGNGKWLRSQSISDHKHNYYVDNIEEYVCSLQEIPVSPGMLSVTPEPIVKNKTSV